MLILTTIILASGLGMDTSPVGYMPMLICVAAAGVMVWLYRRSKNTDE